MKIPKSLFSGTILVLVALFCFGMGVLFQMYVLHDSLFDMIPADTHIAGAAGNNNLRSVEREIPTPTLPPVKEISVIEEKIENIVQVVEKSLEIPASSSTRTPPMSVSETPFVRQYYRDIMTYVPPLVQAWRQAKVDWHLILPKHDSTWERFGKNQKGLRILVSKEEQLTDYLTMYRESGLAGKYGKDHGALASYTGW